MNAEAWKTKPAAAYRPRSQRDVQHTQIPRCMTFAASSGRRITLRYAANRTWAAVYHSTEGRAVELGSLVATGDLRLATGYAAVLCNVVLFTTVKGHRRRARVRQHSIQTPHGNLPTTHSKTTSKRDISMCPCLLEPCPCLRAVISSQVACYLRPTLRVFFLFGNPRSTQSGSVIQDIPRSAPGIS